MFVIIGGLIVVVLMALLLGPYFVDWTGYKASFEAEASKILGRPVRVAGAASARLLPFPSLTFTNVRVGEDAENPVLTVDKFSMDAELAPFLSGEVLIFDMRVDAPHGVVSIDKDGVANWALRPQAPFEPSKISVENMVVTNGRIDVVNEAFGTTHRLDVPQAIVSARALTGPWHVVGDASFDGEPLKIDGATGQLSEKSELPVNIRLIAANRSLVAELDGSAASKDGVLGYSGKFTLRPATLTEPAKPLLKDGYGVAASAGEPFRLAGKFDLNADTLNLPEYRLETGPKDNPYVATGSGRVSLGASPRFDFKVDGTQVNLAANDAEATAAGASIDRVAALRTFLESVPFPEMAGTLDVKLPAIVAGDTTIRDVAFYARPEKSAWRVSGFQATLPGRTKLEADGLMSRGDNFGFVGTMLLASNQPAGFSNWLTGNVDPAVRRLEALGFSANVNLTPERQEFDGLELALGSAVFKGKAERRTDGERPAVALALKADALPLDDLTVMTSAFTVADGWLTGTDFNISLDAGPVSHQGLEAKGLGVSLRLKDAKLDIDRLMISDLSGASLSATGTVTDFLEDPSATLDASIVSADGAVLINALQSHLPQNIFLQKFADRVNAWPGLLKDMQSSIVASTALDGGVRNLTISSTAKAANGELTLAVNATGPLDDPWGLSGTWRASVSEDDPLALVTLTGIPVIPLGAPGPATVDLSGEGSVRGGMKAKITADAPGTSARFEGTLQGGDAATKIEGRAVINSEDFDPYLVATGMVFAGVGAGTPLAYSSDVTYAENGLHLNNIEASVAEDMLSGTIDMTFADRPKLSGALNAENLNAKWVFENILGMGTLDGDGARPSTAAFATHPVSPFDGQLKLKIKNLDLGSMGNGENAAVDVVMAPDGLALRGLVVDVFDGQLTGNIEVSNSAGTGALSVDFALTGADVPQLFGQEAVTGKVDLSGSMSTTGKSAEALMTSLNGSGIAKWANGDVAGLAQDGFTTLMKSVTALEKVPTLNLVEQLIGKHARSGHLAIPQMKLAWTVAAGVLRMPGLSADVEGTKLIADITANASDGSIGITGQLAYAAGLEAVTGAEPVVPFIFSRKAGGVDLTFDAQPMTQFLTQRALEIEQARVEDMQSALVEKQRLRRDVAEIKLSYVERERKLEQRNVAVRREARRQADLMVAQYNAEQARLAAEAKAKADEEAQKAIDAAKALELLPPAEPNAGADAPLKGFDTISPQL